MKKGTQSRGYFIGGIIFVVILTFIVVKGDLLLNYVMSQKDALPVRAVKIDGVFKQLTKKQIADVTGRVCAGLSVYRMLRGSLALADGVSKRRYRGKWRCQAAPE